jgi:lipid II:glycine glycyltransferase (peptidoglycan interpeptide bridge formation enzyme)
MSSTSWNKIIADLPNPHILQTSQWAEVKQSFGWNPYYFIWQEDRGEVDLVISQTIHLEVRNPLAASLVLERKAFPGLSVLYLPKGPLLSDWSDHKLRSRVLHDLLDFAENIGALQVKIDPDVPVGRGVPGEDDAAEESIGMEFRDQLLGGEWRFSPDQIQFRNTYLVDLRPDEDQLLARMKSKTRYNIRLSGRKGIQIRLGNQTDLSTLYQMYAQTSVRGGFTIRDEEYYQTLWHVFMRDGIQPVYGPAAQPIIAEYNNKPVAGAVLFRFGDRAWYLHGMSVEEHSEKMPTYLVQWEAIRWAKSSGCTIYDMWGAPDQFGPSDPLWGVYRFKSGFGGEVLRTIGAWDYPVKPLLYQVYTKVLPLLLEGMRVIGDRGTAVLAGEGSE